MSSRDLPLLTHPLPTDLKLEIIAHLWGVRLNPQQLTERGWQCESYFEYYADQCGLALHEGGRHVSVRTHQDVFELALLMQQPIPYKSILDSQSSPKTMDDSDEDELLANSVHFVARLTSMVQIGRPQQSISSSLPLPWDTNTLKARLDNHFNPSMSLEKELVKLDSTFTARNLERLASLTIVWTANLADHLRLFEDDTKLALFHHVTFLERSLTCQLPDGLAEETIQTLALLLPSSDRHTRTWFRGHQALAPHLDPAAAQCGRLRAEARQLEKFHFWRERLIVLKQFFDDSEPRTLAQWWRDRRQRRQWYTFWIAALVLLLTVVFGVIQCVEGGLQVWAAYRGVQ